MTTFSNTLMSEAAGTNLAGTGKGSGGGDVYTGIQTSGTVDSVNDTGTQYFSGGSGSRCVQTDPSSTSGLNNINPPFAAQSNYVRFRGEFKIDTSPSGQFAIINFLNGNTRQTSIDILATGQIVPRDGANTNMGSPSYMLKFDGTVYRLEIRFLRDSNVGTYDYALYEGAASTTPVASGSFTNKNLGATGNITNVRFGSKCATSTATGGRMRMQQIKMDEVNDGTFIGPYVAANAAPIANAGVDKIVEAGAPVTLTGVDSDTDGTVASRSWIYNGTIVSTSATYSFTVPVGGTETTRTYTYRVVDDKGAVGTDDVLVTTRKALIAHKKSDGSFEYFVSRLI